MTILSNNNYNYNNKIILQKQTIVRNHFLLFSVLAYIMLCSCKLSEKTYSKFEVFHLSLNINTQHYTILKKKHHQTMIS